MINFFRINDPLRVIFAVVLLALVWSLSFLGTIPDTIPQLTWRLTGERLSDGFQMYEDVWTPLAPLSTGIYWILSFLFGNVATSGKVLAFLLILQQAATLNFAMIKSNVFEEKNYLPALLYVSFLATSFDYFSLSPVLISMTPLTLMYRNILRHGAKSSKVEMFYTGLYWALATMCYAPNSILILVIIVGFFQFKNASFRHFIIVLFGFAFTWSLWLLYAYIGDTGFSFYKYFIESFFILGTIEYVNVFTLGAFLLIPFLFFINGFLKSLSGRGMGVYQVWAHRMTFWWGLVVFSTLILSSEQTIYQFILLAIPFSYFGTQLFTHIQNSWHAELVYLLGMGLALLINMVIFFQWQLPIQKVEDFKNEFISLENYFVDESKRLPADGKTVLVMGDDLSYYQNNKAGTAYLNWKLAAYYEFDQLNDFKTIEGIYDRFKRDKPEIIVDQNGLMPKLLYHLPALEEEYYQHPITKELYYRKDTF